MLQHCIIKTLLVIFLLSYCGWKYEKEKVVGIYNFVFPMLIIRDVELAHSIFTTNFAHFANNDIEIDEKTDPIFARNMFAQKDAQWKRTRQLVTPGFTQGKIKSSYDRFEEVASKLVKHLESHPEEVEIRQIMAMYTSEIVAHWGIGIDGHSFTDPDPVLIKVGKLIFEPTTARSLLITCLFFLPSLFKMLRISFVPKEVNDFFNGLLRKIIRERDHTDAKYNDYLQYFVDQMKKRQISKNEDQDALTEDDVIGGVVSFFVEGYETSSMVLTFLLWYLAKYPEIQENLRKDIDEVFDSANGKPSLEAIVELPSLNRAYLETVRMHTAFNSSKICTKPFSMDIGKGKPLQIKPGQSIVIPLIGIQTDPLYWEDPLKFNPDRFLDETLIKRKGVFMPFGEGPRMCIGMRIAQTMIKTAVTHILHNFVIENSPKTPDTYMQDPKSFLPRHLGGCYAKFVKRH